MVATERFTREAMKPPLEPFGLVEAVKAGGLVHIAGQTGIDASHQVVAGGVKAQALQAFRNIKEVLELAGGSVENLVHLTWYLVEDGSGRAFMDDAVDIVAAREEILPSVRAGSTAVRVKALLTPEILVEIQAVAAL